MKTLRTAILLLVTVAAVSCSNKTVVVTVANESGEEVGPRMVELQASDIVASLASSYFYITNEKGEEVPSQLTGDSSIVFMANVPAGESRQFTLHPSDTAHIYTPVVFGRIYPERRDDVAFENQLVGFRIYGPGTQAAGETAYGYDIFLKYPSEEIIVPQLYAPETDPAVWAKVDSLRAISDELADEYINTFSYHIDHGKGFDPFAVGPTLGAGVAAIYDNGAIDYPWCYDSVELIDNGPIRFTAHLRFAPKRLSDGTEVVEHRIITLDSDSYLNTCEVWYEGLESPRQIVTGFPLRDETAPYASADEGIIAYSSPVSGENSGRAILGIYTPEKFDSTFAGHSHILGQRTIRPGETFKYSWGFSWDKTEIASTEEWITYLKSLKNNYTVSIHH